MSKRPWRSEANAIRFPSAVIAGLTSWALCFVKLTESPDSVSTTKMSAFPVRVETRTTDSAQAADAAPATSIVRRIRSLVRNIEALRGEPQECCRRRREPRPILFYKRRNMRLAIDERQDLGDVDLLHRFGRPVRLPVRFLGPALDQQEPPRVGFRMIGLE